MSLQFRQVTDRLYRLGEGPVYDDREDALLFCDIPDRAIHRIDLSSEQVKTWRFPTEVGSFGLTESGRLVVALASVVGIFDRASESFRPIAEIEADRSWTRLNDGKVGPDGAFWVGTMDMRPDRQPVGSLYRVTADGRVEKKVEGLYVSNGLAFTADGRTMFHSDSRGPWIDRWTLDPETGAISGRTRIATLTEESGRPDGAAADIEGCYWSAGVSAARLNRFSPDGRLLESFPMPTAAPTMPCFAGRDLRTLFVTSLREGKSAEDFARYPLTGGLFVTTAPVAGAPVGRFRDA